MLWDVVLFPDSVSFKREDLFKLGYARMTTVKVRPGDSIDKALRALKKRLDKEGVMKSVKAHRFYLKPSIKKRIKSKAATKYKRQRG